MEIITEQQAKESMCSGDVIRLILNKSPLNQARLASILGISTQNMWKKISTTGSMKVSVVSSMLDELGYEVYVVPKGSKLPTGSYKIKE